MSNKICDWERPKIDEDDFPGILDDYFRWVDKLKARNKELEEQHITEMNFSQMLLEENLRLIETNNALKELIPHKVDERG